MKCRDQYRALYIKAKFACVSARVRDEIDDINDSDVCSRPRIEQGSRATARGVFIPIHLGCTIALVAAAGEGAGWRELREERSVFLGSALGIQDCICENEKSWQSGLRLINLGFNYLRKCGYQLRSAERGKFWAVFSLSASCIVTSSYWPVIGEERGLHAGYSLVIHPYSTRHLRMKTGSESKAVLLFCI